MTTLDATAAAHLDRILSGSQLPGLPQSAIKVLEISRNPANGPGELALAIEADPGLATQVLKFVNSSYFGFSREISSVKSAITMIGMRTIKNFVLWNAIYSLVPNPRCGPFDVKSLWQDCVRRGLFARLVGRKLKLPDAEDLFVAGLLQDMAIPVLAKVLPSDYGQLLERRGEDNRRLSQLERERFGWTHADAAARLAIEWNLPGEFAELLRQHSSIDTLAERPGPPDSALIVALSSMLPAAKDAAWHEAARFEKFLRQVIPTPNLQVEALLAEVDEAFAEFAPILKLPATDQSLVRRYQESLQAAG
jgi:HD-like signal output (HDOD) protein